MKITLLLIAPTTLAVVTVASPARAHWQFTKWGMTAQQVKEASGDRDQYTAGSYSFKVDYVFEDGGGLSRVVLTLNNYVQCEALISDLSVKNGKPVGFERPIPDIVKIKWADSVTGDRIEVTQLPSTCFLAYSPMPSGL